MSQDKKLQKAFDKGYLIGANDTHENWIRALNETKGIGLVRKMKIMKTMERICRKKVNDDGEDHQTQS